MTGKDQPDWQRPAAVELAVFFNELLLLAILALAGARLGGNVALRIAAAIALPVAAAVIWGRWLALRASGRLASRRGSWPRPAPSAQVRAARGRR